MNERDIFTAAREITDPVAISAYLDGACGADTELRSRVEALLRAHDQPDSLLDHPAVAPHDADFGATHVIGHQGGVGKADEVLLGFLEPPTRPDALGRIGHYDVLQVLGQGGFGIVFRAFDDVLHRVVAVKVLSPQLAATSPARKRFLREARSSAQVRHDNVVQVYEVGEKPLPYIAMEFIPGETLQQRLDRTGPVEPAEVLWIGRQIAEGLAAAHATDLIHRDIKPGNVLLEGGAQRVKITDFGLARAADDASISQSGIIAGTPMYMAPEQAKGETLDRRADLFSLGSVLYQMIAGRPPFRANGTLAVLKRVAEDMPRPIREIIPETPLWLCDVISKLHAKNPDDRFQSAREVADVLADCEAQLQENAKVQDFSRILPTRQRTAGKSGRWKWVAAAAVLIPAVALALTEVAGVTHLFSGRAPLDSIQPGSESAETATDPDRRAAEYVLSWSGTVKVNAEEREIIAVTDLPHEPFRLTSVAITLNAEGADAGLANFKGCKNLVDLALDANSLIVSAPFTDVGLANFKDCKSLARLSISSAGVTDAGLLHFKECKDMTNLSLHYVGLTDAGLAPARGFSNLTHLDLRNTGVTDAGLVHFQGYTKLTHLRLGRPVTDAGLVHFKDCKRLIELDLNSTEITDAGLVNFKDCKDLIDLNLGQTQVGDAGITALGDCSNLIIINLFRTRVSDVGLDRLKDCTGLTVLELAHSKITDAGLASLKNCKSLTNLGLDSTRVSDAGLSHLAGLDNLSDLMLSRTKVTVQGIKGLAKALPKCAITWDDGVIGPNNGPDRRAAVHVLNVGGLVEVEVDRARREVKALDNLPATAFRLTRVVLGNNLEVTDAGLGEFKNCQNLNVLDLTDTLVTDTGLVHLAGLSELRILLVPKTRVTADGVEVLARALPKCQITWDGGVIEPK
jgi:serine/threonine protein kinase/Leucine-rich repeat (LRR) protein